MKTYNPHKSRYQRKKDNHKAFFLGIVVAFIIITTYFLGVINDKLDAQIKATQEQKMLLEQEIKILKEMKQQEDETPVSPSDVRERKHLKTWKGTASYYSVAGCVGCREDLLMANGQKFDEDAMTLAFNWLPLNTEVLVRNVSNGAEIKATVTDTGGFNELGRIADLSKGLKEALGCNDLCEVEVIK